MTREELELLINNAMEGDSFRADARSICDVLIAARLAVVPMEPTREIIGRAIYGDRWERYVIANSLVEETAEYRAMIRAANLLGERTPGGDITNT